MKYFTSAVIFSAVMGQALAICPGFNYGIGHQQDLGNGVSRCTCCLSYKMYLLFTLLRAVYAGTVYDDSCNAVDGLTTTENPCTQGIFSCSPPPIIFDGYTNTFTHLQSVVHRTSHSLHILNTTPSTRYACRTDPNSGTCGSDSISVCVSGTFHISWYSIVQYCSNSAATTATECTQHEERCCVLIWSCHDAEYHGCGCVSLTSGGGTSCFSACCINTPEFNLYSP